MAADIVPLQKTVTEVSNELDAVLSERKSIALWWNKIDVGQQTFEKSDTFGVRSTWSPIHTLQKCMMR